jgi:hypothetical protein
MQVNRSTIARTYNLNELSQENGFIVTAGGNDRFFRVINNLKKRMQRKQ